MATSSILIVDDDQDFIDSVQLILESQDYRVATASSRTEGMRKLREEKPPLIILDVIMEGYSDGFEMAREIKGDPDLKETSILMLTSVQEKTGIDFSSGVGDPTWMPVDSFVEKTAETSVLISEVKKLLAARS